VLVCTGRPPPDAPLPRYWPHAFIAAFRVEAGAFCSALRIPPDPPDEGAFSADEAGVR
jgi:hypothetical protein